MSKKTRRLSAVTRDERRQAAQLKRAGETYPDSVWPEGDYQLGVGHCTVLDDTAKRRKKKNPIGFSQ